MRNTEPHKPSWKFAVQLDLRKANAMGRVAAASQLKVDMSTAVESLNRSCLLAIACVLGVVGSVSAGGTRIRHDVQSEELAGNLIGTPVEQTIRVWLPDGYDESDQDYPVIYWFPGATQASLSGIDFDAIDRAFESGHAAESIIVFTPGPAEFGSPMYLDSDPFGDWQGFFTNELMPLVENTYRTNDRRGALGFSVGGINSLLLSMHVPGIFAAHGANDAAISLISGSVRTLEQFPEGYLPPDEQSTFEEFMARFPDTLEGYKGLPFPTIPLLAQVGAALSPNPDAVPLGDLPYDLEGWIPEAREAWAEYDLLDQTALSRWSEELEQIEHVSMILPEEIKRTNHVWNRDLLLNLQTLGISTQSIPAPGGHADDREDRFGTLLSNVSFALHQPDSLTLTTATYSENFDGLGTTSASVQLPAGWTVSDQAAEVFRDRTNTPFNGGAPRVEASPTVLNVGLAESEDRSLGVAVSEALDGAVIQFLADVSELDRNGWRVKFDVEDRSVGERDPDGVDPVGFHLIAEINLGDGFETLTDFGHVAESTFESSARIGPLAGASEMRLRWVTDSANGADTPQVLGIDNFEIEFLQLTEGVVGDFNGDEHLSATDIDLLSEAVRVGSTDDFFDLNGDRLVDDSDRELWVEDIFGTLFGDADLNGAVEFNDFLAIAENFGKTGGWAEGDTTGDGRVEFADFLELAWNFGKEPGNLVAIPEPSAAFLMTSVFWLPIGIRRIVQRRR